MRIFLVPFVISFFMLVSCNQQYKISIATQEIDKAVIAVVLEDFANWKEVTFGNLEGVLEVEPSTNVNPDATVEGIRSLAQQLSQQLGNDLINSFIARNKYTGSVTQLISGLPWARLRQPLTEGAFPFELPKGTKATGSLTLPGYSPDGLRALVLIHHSWSIHGAVVTYVLSNQNGRWRVVAREQAVFL